MIVNFNALLRRCLLPDHSPSKAGNPFQMDKCAVIYGCRLFQVFLVDTGVVIERDVKGLRLMEKQFNLLAFQVRATSYCTCDRFWPWLFLSYDAVNVEQGKCCITLILTMLWKVETPG